MSIHPNVFDTGNVRGELRVEAEVAVVGSGAGGAVYRPVAYSDCQRAMSSGL